MEIKINFGCGTTPLKGWVNLDNSFSLFLSKFPIIVLLLKNLKLLSFSQIQLIYFYRKSKIKSANADKKFTFINNTVDIIYTSHMLEHLSRIKAFEFIKECHRVLKKDGVLRIVVPDFKKQIDQYLINQDADEFLEKSLIIAPPLITFKDKLRVLFLGYRHHQYMYDSRSIIKLIESAGFKKVCELPPGKTLLHDPRGIDLSERKDESIYVEAIK